MARVLGYGGLGNTRERSFAGKTEADINPVLRGFLQPDAFRRDARPSVRRRKLAAQISTVYPSIATAAFDARPWVQADAYRRKPRISSRRLAAQMSTVYSLPRDHAVAIDPIVIEFTVVDPQIRRTGGWVAGSDMVRPIGQKRVRPIG